MDLLPSSQLIHYDPNKGLKKIAVAESGERLFRRAKDVTELRRAIEAKLVAQGEYVCWRDTVVQHGGDHKSASRLHQRNLDLPKDDPGHMVAHRWRKAVCRKDASGSTVIDPRKLAEAVKTALHRCRRVVEQERGFGPQGSGEYKFYTPPTLMEAVREVFGGNPDLDPASDEIGNRTVKAKTCFSENDNSLKRKWHGKTFANFPYKNGLHGKFVAKLIQEYKSGRVREAIVLTHSGVDTKWFDAAMKACSSVCFVYGKIKFLDSNGTQMAQGLPRGSIFFYFGNNPDRFEAVFCKVGNCARLNRGYQQRAASS